MTEKINKFCFYWQSQDSEGDDSFTEWKLFTPDSDVIQLIWKHIHQGKFTSVSFAEELYKSFFSKRVWLTDNAVSILIETDIINSVCNMYWSLNFNINSEVWGRLSVRQTHFRHLSLNEYEKLQIFLNYSLHEDHNSTDSDILLIITLFKSTVNLSISLRFSSVMQITSLKPIKKPAFDMLTKSNTSAKKTATSKPFIIITLKAFIFTDSSFLCFSLLVLLEPDLVNEEDELMQLFNEDEASESFSELKDLWDQVKLLKLKKLALTQFADEKISFLMLLTAWLNETLLLQEEDVISAGAFIKQLLNELSVQTDWTLINKISNWCNDYKVSICDHSTSCNQICSAVNHFFLLKSHIFTHIKAHQAKISQWAEKKDVNWVNELSDCHRKWVS